jgi:predicted RNase H-like HicB family nuclease
METLPHVKRVALIEPHSGDGQMCLRVILDREDDGRWLAEVPELPGVLVYAQTENDVIAKVKALSLRVLADRIEHGEAVPEMDELFSMTQSVGGSQPKPERSCRPCSESAGQSSVATEALIASLSGQIGLISSLLSMMVMKSVHECSQGSPSIRDRSPATSDMARPGEWRVFRLFGF